MKGDQGDIFWRAAFVNLEKFNRVYQIRFVHTLPESNCKPDNYQCTTCKYNKCPAANAAIDGIRLDCQTENKEMPVELCNHRRAVLSGCEMHADTPSVKGNSGLLHAHILS